MDIVSILQTMIEDPEDLSQLPQVIEGVNSLIGERDSLEESVGKLQEINRKYLSMIPIKDETEEIEEEGEDLPTLEDAINSILEGGNK